MRKQFADTWAGTMLFKLYIKVNRFLNRCCKPCNLCMGTGRLVANPFNPDPTERYYEQCTRKCLASKIWKTFKKMGVFYNDG